jgi:hypothetical protein
MGSGTLAAGGDGPPREAAAPRSEGSMAGTCESTLAARLRGPVLALSLLALACGGGASEPADGGGLDRETFITAYVDLRSAAIRGEGTWLNDADRTSILSRHGVTEDQLLAFAELHGQDVEFMRAVWDEVEARLDAIRVLPATDERR